MRVYRRTGKWDVPLKVSKGGNKLIYVINRVKIIKFKISAVLPMPPRTNDSELKDEVTKLNSFVYESKGSQLPTKVLNEVHPIYSCQASKYVVE